MATAINYNYDENSSHLTRIINNEEKEEEDEQNESQNEVESEDEQSETVNYNKRKLAFKKKSLNPLPMQETFSKLNINRSLTRPLN